MITLAPTAILHAPTVSEVDRLEKVLACALETRNFEISQLSSRNNFVLIAQGALVAAALKEGASPEFLGVIVVALIGAVLSLFQLQMSAGAKFWQVRWEAATEQAEEAYLEALRASGVTNVITLFSHDDSASVVREHLASNGSTTTATQRCSFKRIEDWLIMQRFSPSRTPMRMAAVFLCSWILVLLLANVLR